MADPTAPQAPRRVTVHDVAEKAGVSLATVDRVLNGRRGVRPETAQKVEAAIAELGFTRDLSASLLARARDLRVVFLLPQGAHEFMASLARAVAAQVRAAAGARLALVTLALKPLDPVALAEALDDLGPQTCDCAVLVAIEDARVVTAVNAAIRRGIRVITLVSDLPASNRHHFVGIDNDAAGRTAASLMGRFCPAGEIGVILGTLGLADHRQRFESFSALLAREFPALSILPPREGHDDPDETARQAGDLIAAHPGLAGLYNLGAGNAGMVPALLASGRAGTIRVIAHELTEATRQGLRAGAIDVVLDQNPDGEIAAAIAAARALALDADRLADPSALNTAIEIGIFLRDNLR